MYQRREVITLRQQLVLERKKHKWTQKQVAEMLDISEVYVRKIEKGEKNPGRETMLKFEKLYGISSKNLFPDLFRVVIDTKCINNFAN
jgi:putative transcriptional regulator